ncbi:hypothetical protein FYK55_26155 [Roseiconus nitratireducens]|uniref:Uncharacterized protein n=1 Tax=Roseiconus nitratireducens TaxID=2605748 RepID=A0A5M6CY48_9BACT|nr:hypothetical protein [Roseiconus nitratireducens]KAA5538922.1 hypothetical protein FYK55_26155 [Roseiconus nitratireducens]
MTETNPYAPPETLESDSQRGSEAGDGKHAGNEMLLMLLFVASFIGAIAMITGLTSLLTS